MRGRAILIALLGVVVALGGCGGSGDSGHSDKEPGNQESPPTTASSQLPPNSPAAQGIWGRHFVVTAATNSDGDRRLSGLTVRFNFSHERSYFLSWGGCNELGGNIRLAATGMKVVHISTARADCEPKGEAEEEWLMKLIESEPRWRLDGKRLTLESAAGSVDLRGFENPTLCPLSSTGGVIHLGNSELGCYGAVEFVTMYLTGQNRHPGGWTCRHTEEGGGRVRVACRRDGNRWFRVEGLRKWFRVDGQRS